MKFEEKLFMSLLKGKHEDCKILLENKGGKLEIEIKGSLSDVLLLIIHLIEQIGAITDTSPKEILEFLAGFNECEDKIKKGEIKCDTDTSKTQS